MDKPSKLEVLKKRFEAAKLPIKSFYKDFNNDQEGESTIEKECLLISIPEERDSKNIFITDDEDLDSVIGSEIEKFRFIKGYEAIWSKELNYIECEIEGETENSYIPRQLLMGRLRNYLKKIEGSEEDGKPLYEFPSPKEHIKIVIGFSSINFAILQNFQRELYPFSSGRLRRRLTMRIVGQQLTTSEDATEFLLKIANSVLFQIDLATNIPLHLIMDRLIISKIKQRKRLQTNPEFQAPKYEYAKEPLALYWYGRTSTNMPLLQFLAFYQVLEFYFPVYSFTEAQVRIKNLLKNPLFDTTKDTSIAQIINIIKTSAKGKAIGDERSQIKATIQHIVDNESLLKFYCDNEERKNFFDVHKKEKGISKQKINLSSTDNDVRVETALRIYEIRCRIVHSKDEDEAELILPYSSEIKRLKYDLELVEFLARQAIIAGARPLTI